MTSIVNQCSICIENLNNKSNNWFKWNTQSNNSNETIKTLECSHQFHTLCINEWLKGNNTCPLCRNVIEHSKINNKISDIDTVININENINIQEQFINTFINRIKKNKKNTTSIIIYILSLASAIIYILTSLSMINYINDYNISNTNSSESDDIKHNIKLINTEINMIIAYLSVISIFLVLSYFEKKFVSRIISMECNIFISCCQITFTIMYVVYISITTNYIIDYIKLFNFSNKNDERMNQYIINRYFIVVIYNVTISSVYSFIQFLFIFLKK